MSAAGRDRVREILEKVYNNGTRARCLDIADCASVGNSMGSIEAETAIRAAIAQELEGMKKQGIKFHGGRQNSEISAYSPTDNQKVGYNQAVSDCQQAIRGGGK